MPDEALGTSASAVERGAELEAEWDERFDAYREAHPGAGAGARADLVARRLPDGLGRRGAALPRPDDELIATRKASQTVIQWAAAQVPELVGGSADLAPSTLTLIDDGGERRAGRLRRAQPPLRHPRARHGRDRQRPQPARLPRVRRDVPHLQRLHEGRGPARRADGAARRSSSSRTTRSASARTARPTSRSSSSRACGRCRTCTSSGRPAPTRPRWPGASRSPRQDSPTALALSRQGLPILEPVGGPRRRDRARRLRAARLLQGAASPTLILIGTGSEVHMCTRGRRPARGRAGSPRASSACRAWTTSPSRTRPTATRCCRRRAGRGWRSRRPPVRLAPLDRRRRARSIGMDDLRRLGARRGRSTSTSASRPSTSPRRRARWRSEQERERRSKMSIATEVNQRLQRSPRPASSVWLDQIRRSLIESGELERLVARTRCAASPRTRRSSRRRSSAPTTTTRSSSSARARSSTREAIYDRIAITRRAARGRRAARRARRVERRATASCRSRSRPDLAHDTERTLEQARTSGRRVDRPNVMIKIPARRRACRRSSRRSTRASTSTSRCCSRSRPTSAIAEAYIRGLERRHAEGTVARRPLGRLVLRLARRHRGRQAARGSSGAPTCRDRGAWPTRAPPTCAFKELFAGERFGDAARRRAPRCSGRCGPRPASRTRTTPRRMYVDGLVGAAHGQHDADGRRCSPPPTTAR